MAKGLNRRVLATTALRIVDEHGLTALSMRRLAAELDVDPMAAYKHVPNKDALLDEVVDAVLREVDLGGLAGDWRARITTGVGRVLSTMTAHPNAAPLLSARKWLTPGGMAIIEWGLTELVEAGVDRHRAVLAMNATGLFLTGLAQAISGSDGLDPLDALTSLDPAGYPVTMSALAGGDGLRGYDELLEFWLASVLPPVDQGPGPGTRCFRG